MDEINPQVLGQPSGVAKWLGKAPGVGQVLKRIAVKYESVQTQIDQIMNGLRHGKDKLLQDSAELENLYDQVQTAQNGVQQAAYVGELLMERIEQGSAESEDMAQRQKLQTMAHRVSMRVQDLRTMEQVNLQFFASIDMTLQNNDTLCEQIDRTVMVTQSLLTVGLAIQAALANQKQIATAVKQVQDSTAAMLEANAAAIGRQTREIGEMQNDPVIALDRVKNAYESLVSAMDEMEQIRSTGTAKAKAGIAELSRMSAALEPKVDALQARPGNFRLLKYRVHSSRHRIRINSVAGHLRCLPSSSPRSAPRYDEQFAAIRRMPEPIPRAERYKASIEDVGVGGYIRFEGKSYAVQGVNVYERQGVRWPELSLFCPQ